MLPNMNKNENNPLIEYLALSFILSYFIIHKISLVLLGIIFSIYLININTINNIAININRKLKKHSFRYTKKDNINSEVESIRIKLEQEDSKLKLVNEIEELGFIPSLEKSDDINAA